MEPNMILTKVPFRPTPTPTSKELLTLPPSRVVQVLNTGNLPAIKSDPKSEDQDSVDTLEGFSRIWCPRLSRRPGVRGGSTRTGFLACDCRFLAMQTFFPVFGFAKFFSSRQRNDTSSGFSRAPLSPV
jgi:hypothetical protein